ncbi:FAD-dependent oxidoreductase [Synechococcus sp. Nb3U1]|uniref:NAD(P)/FAD-dependent oxidoreductase n=1 Tax=Synechococcus sp. Nb3U1 TaxID=1914529 RepID=UPI001F366D58|nr:FAD-dependent oxidoreductase [Synechococcus sp. Nb3U1]MCF2970582.1 FAD-dependent oxidoreductase [Synechococcus sp. Nb3U1]
MSDEETQAAVTQADATNLQSADVIVIGAGVAGLVCARQLLRAGLQVLVLEKSAGLGGRMATRRVEHAGQTVPVDHGAQYLTADSDGFNRWVKELLSLGLLTEWTRSLHLLDSDGLHPEDPNEQKPRYICPEGMSALAKHMATSLQVLRQTRVVSLKPLEKTWQVHTDNGSVYRAASMVVAIPAPQMLPLLQEAIPPASNLLPLLESAEYLPCIAVLAGYGEGMPLPNWKGIKCLEDPLLVWLGLDSSKRSESMPPVIVAQGGPEWSSLHVDATPSELDQAGRELLAHAAKRVQPELATPEWMQVHRWRYSLPIETMGLASLGTRIPCYSDAASGGLPLVCAGDWCAGSRIEGAWLSGQDAAQKLLGMLGIPLPARFGAL